MHVHMHVYVHMCLCYHPCAYHFVTLTTACFEKELERRGMQFGAFNVASCDYVVYKALVARA